MAYKSACDKLFIEGTIQTVAKIGIENTRTKHVADYAGFSEATMYRIFPSKEILLRETFLYIDKKISSILTQSAFIRKPGSVPFELGVYAIWRNVYRYLIAHREETIFYNRYRYSSFYTDGVRSMQQAYNGGFNAVYESFERQYGSETNAYCGFLLNCIFEITLSFAEKVIDGKLEDDRDTEDMVWLTESAAVESWTMKKRENSPSDRSGFAEAGQTGYAGALNAARAV